MKYGFIGAGNMAGAIIKGMVLENNEIAKNIFVTSLNGISSKKLSDEYNVNALNSSEDVIKNSDILILAVKPHILTEILPKLKEEINERKPLIISLAVGKTLEFLENILGKSLPIVRVMPNINAKVQASLSGYCKNDCVSEEQKEIMEKIFNSVGSVMEISENQFSIFGVIAGSSPAFAYLYIDTLARAAVKAGMNKKQALEIAAKTVLGSAKMIAESNEHPFDLIDQVCSPGGTTIEGICTLQSNGFEGSVFKAFDAVIEKDNLIKSKK